MPLALKANCSRYTPGVGLCHAEVLHLLVADGVSFPIIIITGHADAQVHIRAIQAGTVAYLRKPMDEQDFLQAIQHSLGPQVPEP